MIFKRLIVSFVGLGGVAGLVAGVVACGKTANAILPVEFVIPSESFSARADRSDIRTEPGLNAWNNGAAGKITTVQSLFKSKIATGMAATLKAVIAGYIGNYDEIDSNWKPLFADMNAQRSGSGSTMVEMSRLYFRDSGKLYLADGTTPVNSSTDETLQKVIKPKEVGVVQFVIEKIHFDGYATNGNSPNEAFQGMFTPDKGHHWEVDVSADPIILTTKFTNKTEKDIASLEVVNYDVWDLSYSMSAKSQPLTKDEYQAILAKAPSAKNYYKSLIGKGDFFKIFGPNAKPVKVTTTA